MNRQERFLAKLAELEREYREKLRPEQLLQSRLRWENWATLRPMAVAFAEEEIRRRKWRGCQGGVMPDGYDAEAIADEVIGVVLEGKCRLVIGFTRERVVNDLKRLVSQRVRVLHRLKEASTVRSEWECLDEEGETPVDKAASEGEGVEEAVSRQEEEAGREQIVREFENLLAREPELRAIFGCLRAGITESSEIARRLGMDEAAVVKARKKLIRRAGEFERKLKGKAGVRV